MSRKRKYIDGHELVMSSGDYGDGEKHVLSPDDTPELQSTHNLLFEVAPYHLNIDPHNLWLRFKVGTCYGLWTSRDTDFVILAIDNKEKVNGHLTDVLEWFEYSCKREGKSLKILEVWNQEFKKHLIEKRGFEDIGNNNVIKHL